MSIKAPESGKEIVKIWKGSDELWRIMAIQPEGIDPAGRNNVTY
jgi:hypothetical protein